MIKTNNKNTGNVVKKSNKKMIEIVKSKYADAPEYKQSKDFFAMSSFGFRENLYDNAMQVAVHLSISTFNDISGEQDREITSHPLSMNMIYDRLDLVDSKNTNRKMKEVRTALDALVEKGIITVSYLNPSNKNSDRALFMVRQALSTKIDKDGNEEKVKTFLSMEKNTFYTLLAIETDNKRIALMATYCAIASRIYGYKKPKTVHESQGAKASLDAKALVVNFSKQEDIGELIGIKSRKTVGQHIEDLIDMKLIAYYKVAHINYQTGQWKYQLAKYEERAMLRDYLIFKIESHNNEFTIVDVYDERIEANNESEKAQKVEAAKDSVERLQHETASQNTTQVDAGDTSDVVTVETKPKINIEIAEFAKQFILEDDDDEEDFFYMTGQQLMAEYVKK